MPRYFLVVDATVGDFASLTAAAESAEWRLSGTGLLSGLPSPWGPSTVTAYDDFRKMRDDVRRGRDPFTKES